ncbi:MAG: type II secretion system minor pseudopilin GspK, partial [Nitrospira sp.]|nr:type II secretion system minor pseudopilin GspK [Nitrospira sp.]
YVIGDGRLSAKIEDERSKLNLNDLAAGGDPIARKAKILRMKRLFELVQINPDLVDAIVDWVDQDEVPEAAGAESLYYQTRRPSYRAANGPLQTLLELRLIKGVTPEIIDKLSKVATVFPQEGESRVNLNTADPLVLQALDPRITQSIAAEIIQARPFRTIQDLDRVSSFEAIGKELRLQNIYDIKSDLFLARMTVGVHEVIKHATVVLRRDPNSGTGAVLYYRVL